MLYKAQDIKICEKARHLFSLSCHTAVPHTIRATYLYRIIDITYTLREPNNNIAEPSRRRRRRRFLIVKVTGSDDGRDVR